MAGRPDPKPEKAKRKPRQRLSRRQRIERTEADVWRFNLGGCIFADGDECDGIVDGHHVIPKATLKRRGLHAYILDHRNRLPLCRYHHEQHHGPHSPLTRELLRRHTRVFEFAAELDLTWLLEKIYPT